jgi:hypothetical protein
MTVRGRILVIGISVRVLQVQESIHREEEMICPIFVACVSTGMQKLVIGASRYCVLIDVRDCIKMTSCESIRYDVPYAKESHLMKQRDWNVLGLYLGLNDPIYQWLP